jgi:hypothetical protein
MAGGEKEEGEKSAGPRGINGRPWTRGLKPGRRCLLILAPETCTALRTGVAGRNLAKAGEMEAQDAGSQDSMPDLKKYAEAWCDNEVIWEGKEPARIKKETVQDVSKSVNLFHF